MDDRAPHEEKVAGRLPINPFLCSRFRTPITFFLKRRCTYPSGFLVIRILESQRTLATTAVAWSAIKNILLEARAAD